MPMPIANPIDILRAKAEKVEPELSLDTLSEEEKDKILRSFQNCRTIADNHYTKVVEPEILRRRNIYEASPEHYDKIFPQLSETSRWCSKDIKTTCEWILASLIEVFTGSDDPLSVKGVNVEDDAVANKIQQLIRYQLEKKNDYYQFCLSELKFALSENFAVAKVWWKREEKRTPMEVMLDLNDDAAILAMVNEVVSRNIEITKMSDIEEASDFMKVEYDEVVVKANHPVVEYIPSSELRYTPDAANLQDCKFVAQRKVVRGDYLKRRELDGIYKNVDKAIEEFGRGNTKATVLDVKNDQDRADLKGQPSDSDNASKEVELYEAYLWVDYNNDGIFENIIVHAVGNHLLRVVKNDFEFPPFFICCSEYDPNAVFNKNSFADNLEQLQDLKTAVMRQIITNVAKNNAPRIFVNEQGLDMDALMAGDEIIPTQGDPTTKVFVPPSLPLSSISMEVVNYAQTEIEARSGSTRYNQGLDSNALNKMLALDTPVPMADGSYKQNGDIVEGDMVIGSDGKPTKVVTAHPVQMPERAFLMKFESGDVIKSGGEHRWAVKVCEVNSYTKKFEKLPAERIYELMQKGYKIHIPRAPIVEYTEQDLPLDPYVFGAWLGDGNSHTNRFTTMDDEIRQAFEDWAKQFYKGGVEPTKQQRSGRATNYQVVNTPLRLILKDLKVLKDKRYEDTRNNVKHIPEIYLKGSVEQRIALLRGLMDTDGCIAKDGTCVFCNSEPALVESVTQLIASLGGQPSVTWRKPQSNLPNPKECRPHAHITFATQFCPASLPRKVANWRLKKKNWGEQSLRSMEEIPVEPMRCLTVEAEDELYCVGKRYTVTSNTATGITAILGQAEKRNKMVARTIAEKFFIPIYRFLILLNQKYLEDEQMVRLTNENVSIKREDIEIDYDLIINVGQGAGTREAQIQYLMLVLQQIYPQIASFGIVNPKSWYNLVVKLLETLGLRDVTQYLLDPESPEAQQAAKAAAEAQAAAQAEAIENSIRLAMAKSSVPRITVPITEFPPDVQQQYIRKHLGIETTEEEIAKHELLHNEK